MQNREDDDISYVHNTKANKSREQLLTDCISILK